MNNKKTQTTKFHKVKVIHNLKMKISVTKIYKRSSQHYNKTIKRHKHNNIH